MNLIPEKPSATAPNYWCTWLAQSGQPELTRELYKELGIVEGDEECHAATAAMNERSLFDNPGWAARYHDAVRGDCFLVIDDGWDVPYRFNKKTQKYLYGSLELNLEKFPGCNGSPAQRLDTLRRRVVDHGWRGLGVWVAAQAEGETPGNLQSEGYLRDYFAERLRWSNEAGIAYWKVDWGRHWADLAFRRMLTELGREICPGLIIEHACVGNGAPMNGFDLITSTRETVAGRFSSDPQRLALALAFSEFSDVIRTYDCGTLPYVVTLDRTAELLARGRPCGAAKGYICTESNVYLAAALGCTFGAFHHPHSAAKRHDELYRAVRWQRAAPAFGMGDGTTVVSSDLLTEERLFQPVERYYPILQGRPLLQSAPAVIARNLVVPEVKAANGTPFVVAARNPSGAVSVCTLPRYSPDGYWIPKAAVTLDIGGTSCQSASAIPVGIFGEYASLTLRYADTRRVTQVMAQDILADEAVDISSRVCIDDGRLTIDGKLIDEIGLSARSAPDDQSGPGIALLLRMRAC